MKSAYARLTNIVSTTNGTALSKFAYRYNDANQRTRATMVDGSYWVWGYDSLGQVTSAKRYWNDGTPVAGQQFEFDFDTIGNRKLAKTGGDQTGANLRQSDYGANFLNQYTNRTVPGFVDVQGSAHSNATVSLWGNNGSYSPTARKGEYFRGELAVTNLANSVWLWSTNIGVLNTPTNDIITNIVTSTFVPQTPEVFLHDQDGNLTNDGKWSYSWDAENRLIGMESVAAVPQAQRLKLEFGYDSRWRRTSKTVYTNNAGAYVLSHTHHFVYDGWNLIAVLTSDLGLLTSFTWGLDLSGSIQGAGGVGGLLMVNDGTQGTHLPAFDGNGNVSALVSAQSGTASAQYEFGPFGEVLRATGPMAKTNPFRFSTKFQDDETGLLYYGFRYYDPIKGTWNSRDPLAERGDVNLYSFVRNSPVLGVDPFGLFRVYDHCLSRVRLHIGIIEDTVGFTSLGEMLAGGQVHLRIPGSVEGPDGLPRRLPVDWGKLRNSLEKELGSACIEELTIGGHGGPGHLGQYPFPHSFLNSEMITNSPPGTGGVVDFFRFLSTKMCPKEKRVELMACLCADKDFGKTFILDMANLMNSPVHAYDSYYGPGPHENEWVATPGANYPDLVWTHSPYPGSLAQWSVDNRGWWDYYGGLLNRYFRLPLD